MTTTTTTKHVIQFRPFVSGAVWYDHSDGWDSAEAADERIRELIEHGELPAPGEFRIVRRTITDEVLGA